MQLIDDHQKNFVLKVCGTQEFLLERYPIYQYKVLVLSKLNQSHPLLSSLIFLFSTYAIVYLKEKLLSYAFTLDVTCTKACPKIFCTYLHTWGELSRRLQLAPQSHFGNLTAYFESIFSGQLTSTSEMSILFMSVLVFTMVKNHYAQLKTASRFRLRSQNGINGLLSTWVWLICREVLDFACPFVP